MSIVDAVESYRTNEPYFDRESYVEWLKSFTIDERVSDDRRLTYDNLIKRLWLIHFVPSVGNDIDRAVDGTELRKDIMTFWLRTLVCMFEMLKMILERYLDLVECSKC